MCEPRTKCVQDSCQDCVSAGGSRGQMLTESAMQMEAQAHAAHCTPTREADTQNGSRTQGERTASHTTIMPVPSPRTAALLRRADFARLGTDCEPAPAQFCSQPTSAVHRVRKQ